MSRSSNAIGIDLGTTFCCVAVLKNGQVEIISNDLGDRVTPSYVAFTASERLIGETAKAQAHQNPENTIYDAKRLIGRKFSDETVQKDRELWPFAVIKGLLDRPRLLVQHEGNTKTLAPQEVSSMLLSKLKKYAEDALDSEVTQAVITVPAYFNDSQRSATVEAGKIAGLEVLRIISEPVAAALTYGLRHRQSSGKTVLIYDLGGGTCDVTILDISGDEFDVIAKAGDTHLGGGDFDRCLVDHFMQEIQQTLNWDMSSERRARRRLHGEAERAKRTLSHQTVARVVAEGLIKGTDFCTIVTRACFEELCEDHFQRCMEPVNDCLVAAGLCANQIDEVVLVGGSTRIPRVQSLLQNLFDTKHLIKSVHPDEAVAHGAAIQAAILTGTCTPQMRSMQLHDVTPLSLGISCYGNRFSVVIPRNAKVPTTVTCSDYVNAVANCTACVFPVHEGERKLASGNNLLGKFSLRGLPKGPAGSQQFEVTFSIDEDGILTVKAKHIGTDNWRGITINHSSGRHSEEELQQMIADAKRYRKADEERLKQHKAKNLLMEYKTGVVNALKAGLGGALLPGEDEKLKKAAWKATKWLDTEVRLAEAQAYHNKRNELQALCSDVLRTAHRAMLHLLVSTLCVSCICNVESHEA